jgi:amidohydrolase
MIPESEFIREAERLQPQLVQWRRDFHRHPELAYMEERSAGIIAENLMEWGFEIRQGIAKTGILARLSHPSDLPGVLLRVDMDALPIQEQNTHEYVSLNPGVMHACGHDGHMAIGLGVAKLLAEKAHNFKRDVWILFQPAEEGGGGAERMIEAGVLEGLNLEAAFGIHLWNEKQVGWFGVSPGPIMAGAERFEIHIQGRGGHAAMPNLTRDPVVAAAAIISATQTMVARSIDPLRAAVVSISHLQGGSNFNVIPDEVMLEGTIRSLDPGLRSTLIERFKSTAEHTAKAHACELEIQIEQVAPALVNDPYLAEFVQDAAQDLFPEYDVDKDYRVMVSEDMALFLERIPGVFILAGSANEQLGLNAGHHTANFDFDERALISAVTLLSTVMWKKVTHDD